MNNQSIKLSHILERNNLTINFDISSLYMDKVKYYTNDKTIEILYLHRHY